MRYLIVTHPYTEQINEILRMFNHVMLDYEKEKVSFIDHVKLLIAGKHNGESDNVEILGNQIFFSDALIISFLQINEKRFPRSFHSKDRYKRVFYLIRKAREAGFRVEKDNQSRIVYVPHTQLARVTENKYLRELQLVHNFGIQGEITL